MALEYKTGLSAEKGFLNDVFDIDKTTYSPELCGTSGNLVKRYVRCPDSFVLAYDGGKLVGYISLFPVSDALFAELNDPHIHTLRDDDIKPLEVDVWRKDKLNHLFVLSVVIVPEYRGGETIKFLGNKLLEFLRDKEKNGYCIGSIAGAAVSEGGERFLERLYAKQEKDVGEGYKYYFSDREDVKYLLANGLLIKNFKKVVL